MQEQLFRILVINPGSTSTKIGVFDNENCIFEKTIQHDVDQVANFTRIIDQSDYRKQVILSQLDHEEINLSKLSAICGRGGLLRPIEGGSYQVNKEMLADLKAGYNGEHASNLGGVIANEIAVGLNIPAYIVDPVVVDEFETLAQYSGFPEIPRKSIFHALNQKAAGRRAAKDIEKAYEQVNLIITHMGDGITVGAHKSGKVIDVNNGLDGDGPFSLERTGTVPAGDLVSLCYSGKYSREEMMNKLVGQGGLVAFLQTNDAVEIENKINNGDQVAKDTYEAMAYQIAKEIGSMSAVLAGKVDAIVMTGGLAYSKMFIDMISKRTSWIADIIVYPGKNELQALAEGTLRVLRKEELPKVYPTIQE